MANKPFRASQFKTTQFSSAEDKAKFANNLVVFIESGFQDKKFSKAIYDRLMHLFGHIAHYNREGFFYEWFSRPRRQLDFLKRIADPAHYISFGDWSDVEQALAAWIINQKIAGNDIIGKLKAEIDADQETAERRLLAELKTKYPDQA